MQSDCQILWKKCLEIIKDNLPEEQFNTWFRPIIPYSFNEKNEFRILVPSNFFGEYIEANFQKLLLPVVRRVMGPEVTLIYRVATAGDVTDEDAMMDSHAEPSSNKEMPHTSVPNLFEQRRAPQDWNSYLNPKYSFDNYFVYLWGIGRRKDTSLPRDRKPDSRTASHEKSLVCIGSPFWYAVYRSGAEEQRQ